MRHSSKAEQEPLNERRFLSMNSLQAKPLNHNIKENPQRLGHSRLLSSSGIRVKEQLPRPGSPMLRPD
ncbi:unnamed protein product [Caretta caretta]